MLGKSRGWITAEALIPIVAKERCKNQKDSFISGKGWQNITDSRRAGPA